MKGNKKVCKYEMSCFSDSHGSRETMARALRLHPDAEVVFFLGDGLCDAERMSIDFSNTAFIAVRGNCDAFSVFKGAEAPAVEKITLEGLKIVLTHGDKYMAKHGLGALISLAKAEEADILLFGHTHTPFEKCITEYGKPIWLFNPGSASLSSASFGVLTLGSGAPLFSHGKML